MAGIDVGGPPILWWASSWSMLKKLSCVSVMKLSVACNAHQHHAFAAHIADIARHMQKAWGNTGPTGSVYMLCMLGLAHA